MRLAKYLAHCGVASRRVSEKIVAAGRVKVGGDLVTDPARNVDDTSEVSVDGRPVSPEAHEVWAVNKPAGVTSTAREPGRRRAVVELVDSAARLYPVGRLDADSSGLILLTNDGELANGLTHPRYGVRAPTASASGGGRATATCGGFVKGSSSTTARRPPRGCAGGAHARLRSRSARDAIARCGAWPRRWGTRSTS